MKILKIAFKNINALRGEHLIDFTAAPFTASSLFAITGPTGSGKSSILDVISLALFNQVPRLGKISKNEILSKGAILTRNQPDAYARVTYESKSGVYTSGWSISTARTGSLRDYEMEILDEASDKLLDLKKSDVPAKNEELIGLNYNQFIKSVLLAQGEFAQFLKVKKDERGELLEKITGTGIYRQLGKKAFDKHKLVNQEIQQQQDEINMLRKDLLEEEQRKDFKKELEEKEALEKKFEKEIGILDKILELKTGIADRQKQIRNLDTEREKAAARLTEFEETSGHGLKQHQKLSEYTEELRKYDRLFQSETELKKEIELRKQRKEENASAIKNLQEQVKNFTGSKEDENPVEEQLQKFSAQVRGLQDSISEKQSDFKSLHREFLSGVRILELDFPDKDPEIMQLQLNGRKSALEDGITALKVFLKEVDLGSPDGERQKLRTQLEEVRDAEKIAGRIEQLCARLAELGKEEARLDSLMEKLPAEIRHSEDQVKLLQETLRRIKLERENQLLLASLEEHRQHLAEGSPCPLCGSLQHPYAAELPEKKEASENALQEAEKELANWSNKLSAHLTSREHYRKDLGNLLDQKGILQKDLKAERTLFDNKYEHFGKVNGSGWKELSDGYVLKLDKLEQYERELRNLEAVQTGLPLLAEMAEISAAGKKLRKELQSLYRGTDIHEDVQKYLTAWTKQKELQKNLSETLSELREKHQINLKELEKLEEELKEPVAGKGFENVLTAAAALLPEGEYLKLLSAREEIRKEINASENSLKLLKEQLEESKKADVSASAEELQDKQRQLKSELEQLGESCQHLKRMLLNDKERRQRIEELEGQIAKREQQNRRWRLLNELIGDSQGKKFNEFAQDLTLTQLLKLANVRLRDLSDRYRIDKALEDEDDGLVAIDEHMGGQRRSVKTLSGGETFLLSLSMALALSDLASRNVEINSLFIDEGFGTLDPETLDQTLDTLEKLQAESSKTVGIISHVDSLKERITTQIRLKRSGQGYSSLEVGRYQGVQ